MQIVMSFLEAQWISLVGAVAGVYLGEKIYTRLRRAAGIAALKCFGLHKPK